MGAQAHSFLERSHQETEREAIQPSSFAAKWINSLGAGEPSTRLPGHTISRERLRWLFLSNSV